MYIPLDFPYNFTDSLCGVSEDFLLLNEDRWLSDIEVRYSIQKRYGRWHLSIIYISIHNPFKFIIKQLDSYPTRKQAITYGEIFQQYIRKKKCETLKMNEDVLNICSN